jgi:hypothetical protein
MAELIPLPAVVIPPKKKFKPGRARGRRGIVKPFVPAPNRPAISNPLSDLCKMMGITVKAAARMADVAYGAAAVALDDKPIGATEAYVRIMIALGLRLRAKRAEPIQVWIDLDRLDAFYSDNQFRSAHDLAWLPKTKIDLRSKITELRDEKGFTYGKIVDWMQANHICTQDGHYDWRRSGVGQSIKVKRTRSADNHHPLLPADTALSQWRELLLRWIIAEASGPDAGFCPRYGVVQTIRGNRLWIISGVDGSAMTEMPRQWFLDRLGNIPWLNGAWGERTANQTPPAGEDPSPSTQSSEQTESP